MKSVSKLNKVQKMQSVKTKQAGFTLIELIMVIVILGVLASFALPKFASLSDSAKESVIAGVQGSVRSASALTHAQWLAGGGTDTTVTMEDGSVVDLSNATTANGYILSNAVNTATTTITNLEAALDIDGDLIAIIGAGSSTIITYSDSSGYPATGSLCVIYVSTGAAAPTVANGTYTDVGANNPSSGTFDADHANYAADTCA